jgi:hypothetical protein
MAVRRRGIAGAGDECGEAPTVDALSPRGGGTLAATAAASGTLGPSRPGRADSRAATVGKRGGAGRQLLGTWAVPVAAPGAVVPASSTAEHRGGAGSRPGIGELDPTFRSPMVVLVGGGRHLPLLRRRLRQASRGWCAFGRVHLRGTLGWASGQEISLLLLATATPAGAVFLLGGVAMALTALPHIERRGKP